MKIIVLYGSSTSEKSTTINQVVDHLAEKITKTPIEFGCPNDFEAELQYKNKRIGIYSFSETQYRIKDAIKRYEQLNSDLLLITYNTERKQIPSQLFCAEHISVINKTSDHQRDCNTILEKIEELV